MIEINEIVTEIRRLLPKDAELYRELRLEALRRSPEAFSSTFETEVMPQCGRVLSLCGTKRTGDLHKRLPDSISSMDPFRQGSIRSRTGDVDRRLPLFR